jgi:PAS domain S-box-containing protein
MTYPTTSDLSKALIEIQDLYDNAPVGYHSIDKNGLITRINNIHLKWLGYTYEEVVGKMNVLDILPESLHTNFFKGLEELKKNGLHQNIELFLKRKDGSTFPVLLNTSVIYDEKQQMVSTRSVIWDMTQKHKLEADLRRTSEELFQANQDKNRFIGIASHDLQNPITAISMSVELLQKTGSNLTPMQKKLIANMHASAERMHYLVMDMLTLNRIERGVLSDDYRTVNLKTFIWDTVSRFQIFANRKNITLRQDIDEKKDWRFVTEPNYLTQIIENLVSNAIKYSHKEKMVTISLRKNIANPDKLGTEGVQIIVADEGQGFKPEEMPLLYRRFQQLSARPTAGEASTGLGLSVVKEYVDILRGRIECKSKWEKGTTFTVTLPLITI